MTDQQFLYIWLGAMAILSFAVFLSRTYRGRRAPAFSDFLVVGFTLAGIITLIRGLLKVIVTNPEIQTALEWDGTIAFCIGSFFGLYFAIKEIIKLF